MEVCLKVVALSPHLPTVQFLIAYSMQRRRRDQQSKQGRIRNEAKEVMQATLATKMSDSLLYHGLSHISKFHILCELCELTSSNIVCTVGLVCNDCHGTCIYRQLYQQVHGCFIQLCPGLVQLGPRAGGHNKEDAAFNNGH